MVAQNANGSGWSAPKVNKVARKGFLLRSQVCFVTWSQSRIHDCDEFYHSLLEILPAGTKVFGSREFHEDGRPHYHAVLFLPSPVYWSDAGRYFVMKRADGQVDTRAIHIQVPGKGELVEEFLQRTQAYCVKEGEGGVFGKPFGQSVMASCANCRSRLSGDDRCFCLSCFDDLWHERVSFAVVCLVGLLRVFSFMRWVLLTGVFCLQIMGDQWRVDLANHRTRMLNIQKLCVELSAVAGEELARWKV